MEAGLWISLGRQGIDLDQLRGKGAYDLLHHRIGQRRPFQRPPPAAPPPLASPRPPPNTRQPGEGASTACSSAHSTAAALGVSRRLPRWNRWWAGGPPPGGWPASPAMGGAEWSSAAPVGPFCRPPFLMSPQCSTARR